MKNIYMRTPRRWMVSLAKRVGFNHTSENKVMFSKPRGFKNRLKFHLLNIYKSSPLPPIEWFIPFEKLFFVPKSTELIIESGSKLIKTKKSYITYVENGLGIFSFNTRKVNVINVFLLKKVLRRNEFKGFVFYSEAARLSTKSLLESIGLSPEFEAYDRGVIYPYASCSRTTKKTNNHDKGLKILFCSSSFNLKGGRELISAFNELSDTYSRLSLTIVTDITTFEHSVDSNPCINLMDFNLNEDDFSDLLSQHDVIVHPTYFDTHALVLLEALNSGLPIISTDIFALKEYVSNNGILISNPFEPYNEILLPNFNGEALSFAAALTLEPINRKLESDIKESIEKILINTNEFTNAAVYHSKSHRANSDNVATTWIEMIASIKI